VTRARAVVRSAVTLAIAAYLALSGCAKPGPPPGGPVDEDAPWVVSTEPADGETDVSLTSNAFVLFSEEMDRASVERSLRISPTTTLRTPKWQGPRLEVRFADALEDSTTYVLTLGDGARDYHSVAMDTTVTFAFSTGKAVDDCSVSGRVLRAGEPVVGATVWVCPTAPAADSLGVVRTCGRAASTSAGGSYELGFLSATRSPYTLVAFVDADADGAFTLADETGAIVPDTLRFAAAGDTVRGLELALETPRETMPDQPEEQR